MPIDDPAPSRALERLEAEARHRSPSVVRSLRSAFLNLLQGDIPDAVRSFTEADDALGDERSAYLLRCIVADVKRLNLNYDELSAQLHQYLETDWGELWADANRKARVTRAKERIRRISQILASSIREPIPPPDETEEAMRIAMELTDDDVLVLERVYQAAQGYEHSKGWNDTIFAPEVPEIPRGRVLTSFAKLQAFGLIIKPQDHAVLTRSASYPTGGGFLVLPLGVSFVESITRSNESESN